MKHSRHFYTNDTKEQDNIDFHLKILKKRKCGKNHEDDQRNTVHQRQIKDKELNSLEVQNT